MASLQCYKPTDQTCHQSQPSHCMPSKLPGHTTAHSQTDCFRKTDISDHGMTKTQTCVTQAQSQTRCSDGHHHKQSHGHAHGLNLLNLGHNHSGQGQCHNSGGSTCNGKATRHHKKSFLAKIKDKISGDSSDSSSSESDSDNEHSKHSSRRKNC